MNLVLNKINIYTCMVVTNESCLRIFFYKEDRQSLVFIKRIVQRSSISLTLDIFLISSQRTITKVGYWLTKVHMIRICSNHKKSVNNYFISKNVGIKWFCVKISLHWDKSWNIKRWIFKYLSVQEFFFHVLFLFK